LKLDGERPVSIFDCLNLVKMFHMKIQKSPQTTAGKNRGNPNHTLALLKDMFVNILNIAQIRLPSATTLDRIGYFVIAAGTRALRSFTKSIPRNLRYISFIFKPDWTKLPDEEAELVLEWISRDISVSARAFYSLFKAVAVPTVERNDSQINVVQSYMNMLEASPENEDQALETFKKIAEKPVAAVAPSQMHSLTSVDAEPRGGDEGAVEMDGVPVSAVSLSSSPFPTLSQPVQTEVCAVSQPVVYQLCAHHYAIHLCIGGTGRHYQRRIYSIPPSAKQPRSAGKQSLAQLVP
jgi:hypothetical protein